MSYPEAIPHKNSQRGFLDAILRKGKSLTPGEYGRRALALCLAIQDSSNSGKVVAVKHFKGDDKL